MTEFLLKVDDDNFLMPITAKEIEDALLESGYGFIKVEPCEEAGR